MIPTLLDVLSIQGVQQILVKIKEIKYTVNSNLKVLGAVGVAVNANRNLSEEIIQLFEDLCYIKIFNQKIRNNVKVAEAPSYAQSVIDYAPTCTSSLDYKALTNQIIFEIKEHYGIARIPEIIDTDESNLKA